MNISATPLAHALGTAFSTRLIKTRARAACLPATAVLTLSALLGGNALADGTAQPVINPALSSSAIAQLAYANNAGAAHGYTLLAQHALPDGNLVHRVQHTWQALPVFGSESVLVTDNKGRLLAQSHTDLRTGLRTVFSTTGLPATGLPATGMPATAMSANGVQSMGVATPAALKLQPALSATEAISRARSQLPGAQALRITDEQAPQAQLMIYPLLKNQRVAAAKDKAEAELNAMDLEQVVQGHELVYLVKLQSRLGDQPMYRDAIVSAQSGAILKQWDSLQTVAGTGHGKYSGTVPVETTLSAGVYKMIDPSRGTGGAWGGSAVLDFKKATSGSGVVFANSTNVWGNIANELDAVDAGWALRNAYDLLKNTQNWKGMDGRNSATNIAVHYGSNVVNVWWEASCNCIRVGDSATPLATLDIVGHELGHALTFATANFVYSGESGALNEAASDIFGEMVEAWGKSKATGTTIPATGNDWILGKEAFPNGLRTMYKPSKDGMSPDAWSSSIGNMDVHYSSGPANRMFYFLAKGSSATTTSDYYSKYLTQAPKAMAGIGNDKAYRIWFRALSTKLTSSANYSSTQKACVQAATELYGATSKEVIAVKRAFAAINVGADVTGG